MNVFLNMKGTVQTLPRNSVLSPKQEQRQENTNALLRHTVTQKQMTENTHRPLTPKLLPLSAVYLS